MHYFDYDSNKNMITKWECEINKELLLEIVKEMKDKCKIVLSNNHKVDESEEDYIYIYSPLIHYLEELLSLDNPTGVMENIYDKPPELDFRNLSYDNFFEEEITKLKQEYENTKDIEFPDSEQKYSVLNSILNKINELSSDKKLNMDRVNEYNYESKLKEAIKIKYPIGMREKNIHKYVGTLRFLEVKDEELVKDNFTKRLIKKIKSI